MNNNKTVRFCALKRLETFDGLIKVTNPSFLIGKQFRLDFATIRPLEIMVKDVKCVKCFVSSVDEFGKKIEDFPTDLFFPEDAFIKLTQENTQKKYK